MYSGSDIDVSEIIKNQILIKNKHIHYNTVSYKNNCLHVCKCSLAFNVQSQRIMQQSQSQLPDCDSPSPSSFPLPLPLYCMKKDNKIILFN